MLSRIHNHVFIRQDNFNIGNVAILIITDKEDQERRSDLDAMDALKSAITEWVSKTSEGQKSYKNSSEDYNLGDFMDDFRCKSIERFISKAGIESLEIEILTEDQICAYDEHLTG